MIETQGTQNTSIILLQSDIMGALDAQDNENGAQVNPTLQLNNREIYTRVASNIELISLYL